MFDIVKLLFHLHVHLCSYVCVHTDCQNDGEQLILMSYEVQSTSKVLRPVAGLLKNLNKVVFFKFSFTFKYSRNQKPF